MIVVPITKIIEIITSIQVYLISRWAYNTGKMVERKAFIDNPKHQYCVSQRGEHDCNAHNKKNGDYYEYLSLPNFPDKH